MHRLEYEQLDASAGCRLQVNLTVLRKQAWRFESLHGCMKATVLLHDALPG